MFRSSILLIATLFIVFEQVCSSPAGFGWWFGGGDDKDNNKGFFEFWNLNQNERKRDQGKKKIRFALFNRKNDSWVEMQNGTVPKGIWHKGAPLQVLLHSYSKETLKSSPEIIERQRIIEIGRAYGNASSDSNIVVVDWTALAVEPVMQYNFVVGNVPIVGEVVGEFLIKLLKSKHLASLENVHMVGFGLGAHVAGVAGKKTQQDSHGGTVGRITGLDPAGVGFDDETGQASKNKTVSLWKTDAEFVDVIHCNLGASRTIQDAQYKGRYGSGVQAGHADFYPNGGTEQNGCKETGNVVEKDCHSKACTEYFVHSIGGEEYVGCGCQDYEELKEGHCNCTLADGGQLMGEHCSKEAKGKYFLTIDSTEKSAKKGKEHKAKGSKGSTTTAPKKKGTTTSKPEEGGHKDESKVGGESGSEEAHVDDGENAGSGED